MLILYRLTFMMLLSKVTIVIPARTGPLPIT